MAHNVQQMSWGKKTKQKKGLKGMKSFTLPFQNQSKNKKLYIFIYGGLHSNRKEGDLSRETLSPEALCVFLSR